MANVEAGKNINIITDTSSNTKKVNLDNNLQNLTSAEFKEGDKLTKTEANKNNPWQWK